MVVRTLNVKNDHFQPTNDDEEIPGPEVPYINTMGALLFLASHTRLDISFPLNLLVKYSSCPTRRHWSRVKPIVRYLQGTYMGFYYANPSERNLVGFSDARYMSDPYICRSQTGYVFTSSNTAISWLFVKQIMRATSWNHTEILAIHEEAPTVVHEDNAACIAQLKDRYIKEEINTGRVETNTGIEDVNTGSTKVDSGTASKRGQREGKAQMVEEDIQATHKTKEQIRQEETGLEEAIKLQA
ncbi:hypothetical protein Tco_0708326 [Tanacetum coccineum]